MIFRIAAALLILTMFSGTAYAKHAKKAKAQPARTEAPAGSLTAAIDRAVGASCVDQPKTAVRVVEVPSGRVVYDKNGETPLLPASVMKLYTTASALHYLKADYRFKTDVFSAGTRVGGDIRGDLIVKGGGDPKLTPESLKTIADEVAKQGINHVTGNLVVDESFFDALPLPPAREDQKRTQRPYDALNGALSVNFNTVAVHVRPGKKVGDPVIVNIEPESDYIKIDNRGVTAKRKNTVWAFRLNGQQQTGDQSATVQVNGSMSPGSAPGIIYINIDNPQKYAGEAFLAAFQKAGIKIDGKTATGIAHPTAQLLYRHQSEPLEVILTELNRHSNNFIAEQVTKTFAAEVTHKPGSHEAAADLTKKFMNEWGIDTSKLILTDGSGLSYENRVTAKSLSDILVKMTNNTQIGPDFANSIARMGVEGSVRKRVLNSPVRGKARAKSGTLNFVSALAGYVPGKSGGNYSFVIFQNDNKCYYHGAHQIQDKIVTSIYQYN